MLAATVRVTRDLDIAEEAVQDAYVQALEHWPREGVPANPGAWLTTVARRRALNVIARAKTLDAKLPLLLETDDPPEEDVIGDDRLRLVFICCHPALARESQLALTLRLVCGVTTADVAHAFLVSEATMAARITRAKKKIAAARIPYVVPEPDELPARLDAALTVIYLLYTTGHTAPAGDELVRAELTARGLDLARMLHALLPGGEDRRAARAAAVPRGPSPHPHGHGRTFAAPGRAGPHPVGPRAHRRSRRADRRRAPGRRLRALSPAGRDRRAPRPGPELPRRRTGRRSSSSTTRCCACGRRRWSP